MVRMSHVRPFFVIAILALAWLLAVTDTCDPRLQQNKTGVYRKDKIWHHLENHQFCFQSSQQACHAARAVFP